MRSVDEQARAAVGNVRGHGAKAGDARKGKARQTAHGKVVAVVLEEYFFQRSIDFVAAQGTGHEGRGGRKSLFAEFVRDARQEFVVGNGAREGLTDSEESLIQQLFVFVNEHQ